jgi:hypothetical protein
MVNPSACIIAINEKEMPTAPEALVLILLIKKVSAIL